VQVCVLLLYAALRLGFVLEHALWQAGWASVCEVVLFHRERKVLGHPCDTSWTFVLLFTRFLLHCQLILPESELSWSAMRSAVGCGWACLLLVSQPVWPILCQCRPALTGHLLCRHIRQ
jgi:hypothetical protein